MKKIIIRILIKLDFHYRKCRKIKSTGKCRISFNFEYLNQNMQNNKIICRKCLIIFCQSIDEHSFEFDNYLWAIIDNLSKFIRV